MVDGLFHQKDHMSDSYRKFKKRAAEAFITLRQHRNYISNIFWMMIHASIPNLPTDEAYQILNALHERFMPELTDQEATNRFEGFIDLSLGSFWQELYEIAHRWSIYWKF